MANQPAHHQVEMTDLSPGQAITYRVMILHAVGEGVKNIERAAADAARKIIAPASFYKWHNIRILIALGKIKSKS